jgi:ribosome-associated toxin RatA of RatAB toxin-antitoxin module
MVATLNIKRGPLHAEFTTRNLLEPDRRVLMQFVSGPFRCSKACGRSRSR